MQLYHLPLLPGYAPNVNVRSSVAAKTINGQTIASQYLEAEENGYEGMYFPTEDPNDPLFSSDGFIPSLTPDDPRAQNQNSFPGRPPTLTPIAESPEEQRSNRTTQVHRTKTMPVPEDNVAEVIFFSYGVVVFFGLEESQEREVLEDIENADILSRKIEEDAWEVEECHYAVSPYRVYPLCCMSMLTRYQSMTQMQHTLEYTTTSSVSTHPLLHLKTRINVPIAFKSPSHLLKLSIAHALAQSTLLAHYESLAQLVLSDPRTMSIPRQLALTGELRLRRRDALRLTGRLFRLRRDVNLVSNVLDVPELFWSEASLKDLYDAVREYMEIGGRCVVLNERLAVASDLVSDLHHFVF